jgi:hypothetical protein
MSQCLYMSWELSQTLTNFNSNVYLSKIQKTISREIFKFFMSTCRKSVAKSLNYFNKIQWMTNMNNKRSLSFFLLLTVSMMVTGTASSGGNQIDKIPNFGPESFNEVKNNSHVLATYGKMPSF